MKLNLSIAFVTVYANNVDALVPELWAMESLAILQENMVAANLINRDFENVFARIGDVVHTRRPGEFEALRKTVADPVTVQDATSTDVPITLDQYNHVSFFIRDGEETLSMQSLIPIYLQPAALALARMVDRIILGQYPRFMANGYGTLLGLSSTTVKDRILGVRNIMNINKAYPEGRNLIWSPTAETQALSLAEFTNAQDTGDAGQAQREAFLGRKFGFQNYMCQNMVDVAIGNTTTTGAINNASGYGKTVATFTVDGFSGALTTGQWIKIAGDDFPQQVTAHTETLGATTAVTVTPGLKTAVVDNAVITAYTAGAVNFGAGYAAGWTKPIAVDGFTVAPQVGQFITFGTTATPYTILKASTTSITLDRALSAAIADNATVNVAPAGSYNLAFHKNAMTLAVRPLVPAKVGALASVANLGGMSVRATITYDGTNQGHLVTLDMLMGIQVLDTNLGAVMLG